MSSEDDKIENFQKRQTKTSKNAGKKNVKDKKLFGQINDKNEDKEKEGKISHLIKGQINENNEDKQKEVKTTDSIKGHQQKEKAIRAKLFQVHLTILQKVTLNKPYYSIQFIIQNKGNEVIGTTSHAISQLSKRLNDNIKRSFDILFVKNENNLSQKACFDQFEDVSYQESDNDDESKLAQEINILTQKNEILEEQIQILENSQNENIDINKNLEEEIIQLKKTVKQQEHKILILNIQLNFQNSESQKQYKELKQQNSQLKQQMNFENSQLKQQMNLQKQELASANQKIKNLEDKVQDHEYQFDLTFEAVNQIYGKIIKTNCTAIDIFAVIHQRIEIITQFKNLFPSNSIEQQQNMINQVIKFNSIGQNTWEKILQKKKFRNQLSHFSISEIQQNSENVFSQVFEDDSNEVLEAYQIIFQYLINNQNSYNQRF